VATTSAASPFSIPRLTGQYRLTGDFDYQVDYAIGPGWTEPLPPNSGLEIQMAVYWDDSRYVQIGRGRDAGGEYVKPYSPIADLSWINSIRIPFSQMSGKFRTVRSGTQLTLRYHDGAVWHDLITGATVATDSAYVYLGSISGNASRAFTAYFDNFTLSSGPNSYHPFVRSAQFRRRADFYVGGVVCDYMAFMNWGNTWGGINPLDPLKQNGMKWVRVGVTTVSSQYLANTPYEQWPTLPWRDEYWSSREFAGQIMRQAQARGYRLNLFLFLSNTAAHASQQNAPPEWAGLSVAETAQRVDQYSFDITNYYIQRGLNIEVYDIGNEIDFGILNFRPGDRIPIPPGVDITNNMDYMRNNVWNIEAQLLQASINGVKRANPNAKIVLHAAGINVSRSNVFVKTFFKTMVEHGVQFDYAGLSNPYNQANWVVPSYTTDCWFQRLQEVIDYCQTLNKQVVFSEASYPHNPTGTLGQAMPEFPYTQPGQSAWTREHLRFLSNQTNVRGFFWFYPDYHMGLNVDPGLKGSSLFQSPTQAMPALAEFRVNLGGSSFDFDGDSRADVSVFRPPTGAWYVLQSTGGFTGVSFGNTTDKIAPADFDGDGKTDVAVYRPSTATWYWLNSTTGTLSAVQFGASEDLPTPADYDGDGRADTTVFRPSNGVWYRLNSSNGSFYAVAFGTSEDKPTVGDYDGDGRADVAVFRPSTGAWYRLNSSNGAFIGASFGLSTDLITPADFDGDGRADVSVFRPTNGIWYRLNSGNGSFFAVQFGTNGDRPTPAAFRY
jgi:arabinogalactan endo-1,4-beta-galactosidase